MYTIGYLREATLAKLDLDSKDAIAATFLNRFPYYANEAITQICSSVKPKRTFAKFEVTHDDVMKPLRMPKDFVSFGNDLNTVERTTHRKVEFKPICDIDFRYVGNDAVMFYEEGVYEISYNARWYTFDTDDADYIELDVPTDILDCIPSYVASQCYKIDDEYKAAVFRNEYEMLLARIDDTDFSSNKHFVIRGDW